MKALILAAGYGTRLYPYTKYFPKPLLKIDQRPVIDYLLDKLEFLPDLSQVAVVTNARFFRHFCRWKEKSPLKKKIRIINDLTQSPKDKLGAIADMYLGIKKGGFGEDYLVLGGDNFLEEGLADFVTFARRKSPHIAIGIVDIGAKTKARNFGVVLLGRKNRIIDFQEKPLKPKSSLAAMCLYYFPKGKLCLIKECLCDSGLSFDNIGAYIGWLTQKEEVYGFVFKKRWFDIGHIQTYRKLNSILKGER
jgi:glucose-1-phosphate thymidylyltransferase